MAEDITSCQCTTQDRASGHRADCPLTTRFRYVAVGPWAGMTAAEIADDIRRAAEVVAEREDS